MKYGESLQQRSVPAWRAHNIDYNNIKHFIKEHTSPGQGEGMFILGRDSEHFAEFGNELSAMFAQQHERINLFVKSKVCETEQRLKHADRQLRKISSRNATAAERRIQVVREERCSRLEENVVRIGEEIRSLARFTTTNRTAIRKLLKKARRWTCSNHLCLSFQIGVFNSKESFLQLDLEPLLEDYARMLTSVRDVYEGRIKHTYIWEDSSSDPTVGAVIAQRPQAGAKTGHNVDFGHAVPTASLEDFGELTKYLVHPDYLVELRVLLLQHVQTRGSKSPHKFVAETSSRRTTSSAASDKASGGQDCNVLIVNNLDCLAKSEGTSAANPRESAAGAITQQASYYLHRDKDEASARNSGPRAYRNRTDVDKKTHADASSEETRSQQRGLDVMYAQLQPTATRDELSLDETARPLYKIRSARQHFIGLASQQKSGTLITLDTDISIFQGQKATASDTVTSFPFAVLEVHTEGERGRQFLELLNESHLLERMHGFSLHHYALWHICKPANMSTPFWIPILSQDIRKLPLPAESGKDGLVLRGSGFPSATEDSSSMNLTREFTDELTTIETSKPSSDISSGRSETLSPTVHPKKQHRKCAEQIETSPSPTKQSYWSEYDSPKDRGTDDSYVVFVDPEERTTLDELFDSICNLLSQRKQGGPDANTSSLGTPKDYALSSEHEQETLNSRENNYGTLDCESPEPDRSAREYRCNTGMWLSRLTTVCLAALSGTLAITFIFATILEPTNEHTFGTAITFATVCSLFNTGIGLVALKRQRRARSGCTLGIVSAMLLLEAISSGGLFACLHR